MISELVKDISPFYVMDILEEAKRLESDGKDIYHFEVGEPDFKTPDEICNAAIKSIDNGFTKYSSSLGINELRQSIADDYKKSYGVDLSYERIIVTMGSSPALLMSMLTILNPGEEIIITDPYYACYPQIIGVARGITKKVPIYEKDNYQIDADLIKKNINRKTKAILINSPSNPTGTLLNEKTMDKLCNLGPLIISDEIYHGLVYENKENSILEFTDNAIVVSGFSKLYSMTGWRLGYMIVPTDMVRYVQKLQQNLFISANPFVQMAGIEAIEKIKAKAADISKLFNERRVEMINGLKSIGFEFSYNPTGAFYIYVNSSGFSKDSYKFAFDILKNTGVAVTPGIDFSERGKNYLRFSYATSIDSIKKGIAKLGDYLT